MTIFTLKNFDEICMVE